MSTVGTLRAKAALAAEKLRAAEAAAEKAEAERVESNLAARAAFWSDAAARCEQAVQAVHDAEAAVIDASAEGAGAAALDAYGDYVQRVTEADVIVRQARAATAEYVYVVQRPTDKTRKITLARTHEVPVMEAVEVRQPAYDEDGLGLEPPQEQHRTVCAEGVPHSAPARRSFSELLEAGVEQLVERRRAEFTAEYLAPLSAQLVAREAE